MSGFSNVKLSEEQQNFVNLALQGKNILVDACIGSGKTTAIQRLCCEMPSTKSILYLTYNKLLKIDAKKKITNRNVLVTNYHGYAFSMLKRMGVSVAVSDLIQAFIDKRPTVDTYDVLIIDEYQDIDLELSKLLTIVKASNPSMQIIAVGDMEQKIYDKTSLRVQEFIHQFLGDYERIEFTKCFRLSAPLAAKLGRVWKKQIMGVNTDCIVDTMDEEQVIEFLASQDTGNILCLGSRTGSMSKVLNTLEEEYPATFNKNTVYASISDNDSGGKVEPRSDSAIFTTYDSSKGLERPICVVFDFTENYWQSRLEKPMQSYTILRNIFCVASSRGKDHIIFVTNGEDELSEESLSTPTELSKELREAAISEMFDFKFKEDIEECYSLLNTEKLVSNDTSLIKIASSDGLIDLSPCIGIYQEAAYFDGYSIDDSIALYLKMHMELKPLYSQSIKASSLDEKILFLTSLETKQARYRRQVKTPYVTNEQKSELMKRLSTRLNKDELVQAECCLNFGSNSKGKKGFVALGYADAVKNDVVYELKFVSELKHEHYLQCACYMIALKLKQGILWNTRDNTAYSITIPDEKAFLDSVVRAVTKGQIDKYYKPDVEFKFSLKSIFTGDSETKGDVAVTTSKVDHLEIQNSNNTKIAVIDTETNFNDEVMSIGIVVADASSFDEVDRRYYIFTLESKVGGMYSNVMNIKDTNPIECEKSQAFSDIKTWLSSHGVDSIFAYNASFDKNHLTEFANFGWYDIMRLAAYKQYNKAIPQNADCFGTGRLKKDYGVEAITRMLTGNKRYMEVHNAVLDAVDELNIIRLLGLPIEEYSIAALGRDTISKCKNIEKKDKTREAETKVKEQKIHFEESSISFDENEICENSKDIYSETIESDNNVDTEYSAAEVAQMLNMSKSTLYSMLNEGNIRGFKRGNKWVITQSAVDEFVNRKTGASFAKGFGILLLISFVVILLIYFIMMNLF